MAKYELQSMLASKQIAISPDAQETVLCHIRVKYGNSALRSWVGFGAGEGNLTVTIELKDQNGHVQYATKSKAVLAMSATAGGGDMSFVVRKTIRTAIKEFGSRL